ncbi:hypothetical protein [Planctomyces sp. SH-PL62]|uniref:hypothetical protein n=1 Tax=Planctomyces sp. SH-PL62 TaxID=1636152 RepID=UPI00078E89FC|nr:hypothetical protein [Planctomyces sp. SH-PL62]AMV40768.1 hypothetical protein VT85_25270 [Planctomyces sp. SH-PL62]
MSKSKDRSPGPRPHGPGRPSRRNRRSSAPALAALEDRRLMSADLGAVTAPIPYATPVALVQATDHGPTTTTVATADPTLSFEGDYTLAASSSGAIRPVLAQVDGRAWLSAGSDALFGPIASLVSTGLPGVGVTFPVDPGGPADDSGGPTTDAEARAEAGRKAIDAAFAKLDADTQAIQDKSEVTPKLLARLRKAGEKVAGEAGEPDATLRKTLEDGIQSVQESGTFTVEQRGRLKEDYTAVLRSAGVSDGAIAELFAAQDAVEAAGHVTAEDLKTLADDRQALQALFDAMPQEPVSILPAFDAASSAPASAQGGVMFQGSWDGGSGNGSAPTAQPTGVSTLEQSVTANARPVGGFSAVPGIPAQFHQGGFETIRQAASLGGRKGGGLAHRFAIRSPGGQAATGNVTVNVNQGASNVESVARRSARRGSVAAARLLSANQPLDISSGPIRVSQAAGSSARMAAGYLPPGGADQNPGV